MPYAYSRPYAYLFLTNFPGPMVIPCPTSIPDSRVYGQMPKNANIICEGSLNVVCERPLTRIVQRTEQISHKNVD